MGTKGNDEFIAGPGTAETGDVLDGKGGTDILKIQEDGHGRTMAPTLSNVEQVWLRNQGTAGTETFSGANSTGITQAWADRIEDTDGGADATVAFTSIGKSVQLGIYKGSAVAATRTNAVFTLNDVAGPADEATLVLDQASVNDIYIAGVETLNVQTQGGASLIDGTLVARAATQLVFTGNQDATVDAIDVAALDYEVDASAMTGGLNITLEDTAAVNETFKGGDGNDALYTVGTNFAAGDSFDGGKGTNTIGIAAKGAITAVTGKLIKNFQVFDAAGASGAAATDYDIPLCH